MLIFKPLFKIIVSLGLSVILLTACTGAKATSPAPPEPAGDTGAQAVSTPLPPLGAAGSTIIADAANLAPSNEAVIDTVEVMVLESFPVQANAVVKGKLPDGCVQIERISQERRDNTFVATIITNRQPNAGCIGQLQSFEQVLPLGVSDLAAGTYTVTVSGVNSVSTTFQLSGERALPPTATTVPPQPTPLPSPTPLAPALLSGSISGVIWNDFCRLLANGAPSAGCIPDSRGGYRADGTYMNGEARIAGVEVTLSRGGCASPSAGTLKTATDANGFYRFDNLEPGPYCVFIEPQVEPNLSLLMPGNWTYPAPGLGQAEVLVGAGENKSVDFGWDDQFDRPPAGDPGCVDQAAYVADVTIPDNTPLTPGTPFVKTWRVRNTGTCTWSANYTLVFVAGEPMGGQAPLPLPQAVQPGEEVDLSISLVAPTAPGVYRGEWKLQNGSGVTFGSRGNYPFYVQIVAGGPTNPPAPQVLAISGLVWDDECRSSQNGTPSGGCVLDGSSGAVRADGLFKAGERGIAGVQIKLSLGECPGNDFVFITTTTDAGGAYQFTALQPSPYCVSIDTSTEPNASLLLPGAWTYPAPGVNSATVSVGVDQLQPVDFGWDYQLK